MNEAQKRHREIRAAADRLVPAYLKAHLPRYHGHDGWQHKENVEMMFRHKKTGLRVQIVGKGELQAESAVSEGVAMIAFRPADTDETDEVRFRPAREFYDRFEPVD